MVQALGGRSMPHATYSSLVRVVLVTSTSARWRAPSAPMLLRSRLQQGQHQGPTGKACSKHRHGQAVMRLRLWPCGGCTHTRTPIYIATYRIGQQISLCNGTNIFHFYQNICGKRHPYTSTHKTYTTRNKHTYTYTSPHAHPSTHPMIP